MLKRLSFLLTLACLFAFGSRAATVSGTVTNLSLGGPAINELVYLVDSSTFGYYHVDSTFTNSSGAYSFSVPSSISSGNLAIKLFDCSQWRVSPYSIYTGSNLTINISICPPITVNGTLNYFGAVAAAGVKVYLIDTNYTFGINYRDSTITNVTGQYSFKVPAGIYMYRVYALSCGTRFSSAINYFPAGNKTINLSLGCNPPQVLVYVRNSTGSAGIYGQMVYLVDSDATHYRLDSAFSDYFGTTRFYVPPATAASTLRAYTTACTVHSQTFAYSGNSVAGPTFNTCLNNPVVSGYVNNATTMAPANGLWLQIFDSTSTARYFVDSTFTDASGYYTRKIPMYVPTSSTMITEAQACGIRNTARGTYSGSSMTLSFAVCSTSTATVSGIVSVYGTGAPIAGWKVYLKDTNMSSGVVVSRDSTITNSAGFYSFALPATVISTYYMIGTPSCSNSMSWAQRGYKGFSLVQNFAVCNTTGLTTLSGIVFNTTGAPVPGANVSLGSTSTTTNGSGAYSITIPASIALGGNMAFITSKGCASRSLTIVKTGANMVRTDTLKPSAWCNSISGVVTKQGAGPAAGAKVYLIGEYYDSTVTPIATMLQAIDSTITNTSGRYLFSYPNVWMNVQRIKAALQPSDPAYWNYLPAYHDSSLVWSGATTFSLAAWTSNDSSMHVSLRAGTNPGGPGFIGGNVLVGANKSTGVGDPLEQRILLLTTDNDVAIGYTFSDASGAFSFPNLAYGTYKLFGDAGGKSNPPLLITLSASATSVTDVVFEENDKKFEGYVGSVGVAMQKADAIHLYPNPAGSFVTINGLNSISGSKSILVRNVSGAVVYSAEATSGDVLTIPTEKLPAGVYLLQLHSATGIRNMRFVKN